MDIKSTVQTLLTKTNDAIAPYLEFAIKEAIKAYTNDMANTLRAFVDAPEPSKPPTQKPVYTPSKVVAPRGKVSTPYVDILNFIRKNEGEHVTYQTIGEAVDLPSHSVKKRMYVMRQRGIVRAEGSSKDRKGLRYYITRDQAVLSKLSAG